MKMYRLSKEDSDNLSVWVDGSCVPLERFNVPIDETYHLNKYGIGISPTESDLFKVHLSIWQHFNENPGSDYCIILENGVELIAPIEQIEEDVKKTQGNWDILFPYDKLTGKSQQRPICLSRFGFFWGYYFYIIKRSGIEKLLKISAIKQPLDEHILTSSKEGGLVIYAGSTDWYKYDETKSIAYQARYRSIINSFETYNVWDDDDKAKALKILLYISSKANEIDVKIGLHAGTLLGAVRHGRIMDWDDDIDLITSETDAVKLIEKINEEGIYNVTKWIWKKTGETYFKIWERDGKYTEGFEYSFPFVDIWLFKEEQHSVSTNDGYTFDKNTFLPFHPIFFEGADLFMPNDARSYLNLMYKDWNKSIKIFSWSHQVKKHVNTAIHIPIRTDNSGKFINYNY